MAATAPHRPARILLSAGLALLVGLAGPRPAGASGGGDEFSDSIFTPTTYVDEKALGEFAGGQLGVVQPGYRRVYLFLAWRAAQGRPATPAEMRQLQIRNWQVAAGDGLSDAFTRLAEWRAARQAAANSLPAAARPPAPALPEDWRALGEFNGGLNCNADAFVRARQTLAHRQQTHAGDWQAWGGQWLRQQDAVFEACANPQAAPLPTGPAAAPAWLTQDGAYQRAAQRFYLGRHEDARADFLAVAADPASPWHTLAAYLAARCLIRVSAGSLAEAERADTLQTARTELERVAADYPPALDMVGWIDMRLRPAERLRGLSTSLAQGPFDARRIVALNDYLLALSGMAPQQLIDAPDAMTRWIGVMQACCSPLSNPWWREAGAEEQAHPWLEGEPLQQRALAVARTQWATSQQPIWLLPLLAQARAPGPGVAPERLLRAEERKAALGVPPSSPLYLHLRYHLLRLQLAQGEGAAADAEIAALLQDPRQRMGEATRNRFLGLKVLSARSLPDFLATAPRRIVAPQGQAIIDADRATRQAPDPAAQPSVGVDGDFLDPLYRQLPLATLAAIRQAPELASERTRLTETLWSRAVLLEQWALADALVDELAQPRATTRALWARFKAASSPADKRAAAALIWVNTPELSPGLQRAGTSAYGECNDLSWTEAMTDANPPQPLPPGPALAFLSAEQRAEMARQWGVLRALKGRNTFLAPTLMAWAQAHRDDPEAPKALHFFVASTRKECRRFDTGGPDGPAYPRQAFQLLHKLWPRSDWARITKYYY